MFDFIILIVIIGLLILGLSYLIRDIQYINDLKLNPVDERGLPTYLKKAFGWITLSFMFLILLSLL